MGLAGPRNKQRISADPQNKAWSNDTGKFGFKMLQKMGWTPGKGLGVDQQGLTSHVSVVRKEDNLGVGANVNTMDNWLSNTDAFSRLLKDLNERIENETEKSSDAEEVDNEGEATSEKEVDDESSLKQQDKKDKKKNKKEKKEKKEKKKKSKKDINSATSSPPSPPPSNPPTDTESTTTTSETTSLTTTLSHARYAHRAKFLRNKRVNNYDSESLEAILGVKKAEVVVQERIERGIEKSEIQESAQIKTMTIRSDVDEYKPSFSHTEMTKTTTTDYIYGSTRSFPSDSVAENNDKRQSIVNSISKSLGFSFVKGEVLNGNDDKNDENDGEGVESDSMDTKCKDNEEKIREKKKKEKKRKREALESEEKNEEESEGKKKKRKSKSKEGDAGRTEKDEKSRKKQEKKKSKKEKK